MWLNENNFIRLITSTYIEQAPYPMIPPRLTGEDKIHYAEDGHPFIESNCCGFFSDCCYGRSTIKKATRSRNNLLRMFSKSRGVNISKRLDDLNTVYENIPSQHERKAFSYHTLRFLYLYASLHQNKTIIQRIVRSITEYNRRNHSEKWFINIGTLQFTTNDRYLLNNAAPIVDFKSIQMLYDLQHPGAALYLARYYHKKITQQSGINIAQSRSLPNPVLIHQVAPLYRQACQWGIPEARMELLDFLLTTKQHDEAIEQYFACPKSLQDRLTKKMSPLIVSRQKTIREHNAPTSLLAPLSTNPSIPAALLLSDSTKWGLLKQLDSFYLEEQNIINILSALSPQDQHDCDFMNSQVNSYKHHNEATSIIMLELHEYFRQKTLERIRAISAGICKNIIDRCGSNTSAATTNALYLFSEEDVLTHIPFIYHPDEKGNPIIRLSASSPCITLNTLNQYTDLTLDNKTFRIYSKEIENWGMNLYNPKKSIVYKAYNTRNINLPLLKKLVHLRYFSHPDFLEQHHIQPFHYRFLEEIAALPTRQLKTAFSTKNSNELCRVLRPSLLINNKHREQKTTVYFQKEPSSPHEQAPFDIELCIKNH